MDQAREGLLSPALQRRRLKATRSHLRGSILDFGCGNGALAAYCPIEQYTGYDADPGVLAAAARAFPRHRFTNELPRGTTFDTIVGLAVIEHLDDPAGHMRRLRAMLASKGVIVLTTPHPAAGIIHAMGAKLGLFSAHASEEHQDLIDLGRMRAIAAAADLAVIKYKRFLFYCNQLFVLAAR